jgi:hypothetical protein
MPPPFGGSLNAATYSGQVLAVFLLFELLPVPVNLDVLFVTGDDFVLDLVGTLLAALVLNVATIVFCFFCVLLNFGDHFRGVVSRLLQEVCSNTNN